MRWFRPARVDREATVSAKGQPCDTKAMRTFGNQPKFHRDEVMVCMILAFAIGNAMLSSIYRLMG